MFALLGLRFSALQRAEIAEISLTMSPTRPSSGVSVLFNEPKLLKCPPQRAIRTDPRVSVLFNEPKLLKWSAVRRWSLCVGCFSALQRAEIAEIQNVESTWDVKVTFQCSSTSRNC